MSTSPSPGEGFSTSVSSNTSGSPNALTWTAFIWGIRSPLPAEAYSRNLTLPIALSLHYEAPASPPSCRINGQQFPSLHHRAASGGTLNSLSGGEIRAGAEELQRHVPDAPRMGVIPAR